MSPAIDAQIRGQVIKEWLSGNTRDEIAANVEIGQELSVTLSMISRKELVVWSKKEGMTMSDVVTHVRLINYIKKLGADLDQIESFIANVASSQEPQKLIDTAYQIAQ